MGLNKVNKKGMFFTVLVMAILLLFLVSYSFSSIIKDRRPIERRIATMNDFVFSVEKDIPRLLYISGFRSILLIEKNIVETGSYSANLNQSINELFYNGSLNGNPEELMKGANFSAIQNFLSEEASKINADVQLSNPVLKVTQDDPWNIKYSLTVNLLVVDKANLSLWNRTSTFVSYVPIKSFEDPIYVVGTANSVVNKINLTSYSPFVDGNDVSNLSKHLANSSYIASSLAPSFLQRLEGDFSPSQNGIESLVYLPKLSAQGITIKNKCVVDYIYFSSQDPSPLYAVTGMQSWFKLDNAHRSIYGVENISYIP